MRSVSTPKAFSPSVHCVVVTIVSRSYITSLMCITVESAQVKVEFPSIFRLYFQCFTKSISGTRN